MKLADIRISAHGKSSKRLGWHIFAVAHKCVHWLRSREANAYLRFSLHGAYVVLSNVDGMLIGRSLSMLDVTGNNPA
jgi:hypothetical protein